MTTETPSIAQWHNKEWTAIKAHGAAKYACRYCANAYVLICTNPACRATGHRIINRKHAYPDGFTQAVINERRAKLRAVNDDVSAQQAAQLEEARQAVKAWKAKHPTRKYCTAMLPYIAPESRYGFGSRDNPFLDIHLPQRSAIYWRMVRVNLHDGTYADSSSPIADVRSRAYLSTIGN